MTNIPVQIGEFAAEFGLNPKTVRYYESLGLLPDIKRTVSGYRRYGEPDRLRMQFIRQAKTLGLTLEEIRGVVEVRARGDLPCAHVTQLVDEKLAEVERQFEVLGALRAELLTLRAAHAGSAEGAVCGLIKRHPRR